MLPTPGEYNGNSHRAKQSYSQEEGEYMTAVKAGIDISQPRPGSEKTT
ncbi:MAG: hypothetical protein KGO82_20535 [Bacteroidota bacterium]|nr:hypothetical protein [Bacteroidota bacterium]